MGSTIWLGSIPILRQNTLYRWLGMSPTSLHFPPNSQEDFQLAGYLECPYAAKAPLQPSMPSPGYRFRPYGTRVIVTNHYTG
ncbi:hypothetical protein TNCV_147451 [Trichonephila clavipes]|nr:hypothetical protein TNCV_147451 [Trichonephila clavipes]